MGFFGELAGALFGGRGRGRGMRRRRRGAGRRRGLGKRMAGPKAAAKLAKLEALSNCGWWCQRKKKRLARKLARLAPPTPVPAPPTMSGYFGDWSYRR